jgi:hypothetical protein
MRRIVYLALAFAVLSAHAASASDNWVIYKGQSASWGYDAGDLGHNQQFGQITATSATYKRRGDTLDGVSYHYAVSTTLLDCTERTVRIKEIALYDNDASLVHKLAANPTAPAALVTSSDADQISKILFSIGCQDKHGPPGAIEVRGFAAAMLGMKISD